MSGFVSSPAPDATPGGTMVDLDAFWPQIDVNHFRDSMRIGGTSIPDARVIDALLSGALAVDRDLAVWRSEQETAGYATLVTVPGASFGTEKRLEILWRRAVYSLATADLRETHGDVTATGTGQARAELLDMSADDHRRNAIHAIRDILGRPRTTVELI